LELKAMRQIRSSDAVSSTTKNDAFPNEAFLDYSRGRHVEVEGWLEPGVLTLLSIVASAQQKMEVEGPIAEIGIHHGRFFIALLLAKSHEKGIAIDIFEDQHLNPDNSGKGNYAAFIKNLERFAIPAERVVTRKSDSRVLLPSDHLWNRRVSIFSVDGAHTVEYTVSDLNLAVSVLAPGGVIILDDCFNPRWPGVNEGLFQWLAGPTGRSFAVFMYGNNKAFIASRRKTDAYKAAVKDAEAEMLQSMSPVTLAGQEALLVRGRDLGAAARRLDLSFDRGGNGGIYLGDGWAKIEGTGVWAVAPKASVRLPVQVSAGKSLEIVLKFSSFVPAGHRQILTVFADDTKVGEAGLTASKDFTVRGRIPVQKSTDNTTLLFEVDQSFVPKTFGVSSDERALGAKLKHISVQVV
jgi:hypothetical protein